MNNKCQKIAEIVKITIYDFERKKKKLTFVKIIEKKIDHFTIRKLLYRNRFLFFNIIKKNCSIIAIFIICKSRFEYFECDFHNKQRKRHFFQLNFVVAYSSSSNFRIMFFNDLIF